MLFRSGDLTEEVYLGQPLSYEKKDEQAEVDKLKKALYGLMQAPRAWNSKLDQSMVTLGFKRCALDDPKDSLQSTEEEVKIEDTTKKECCHRATDEPTTVKTVHKMLQGTAKAMPMITVMRSSNRVWDPGRK